MFNLFGKKKGTINSILLPDLGWERVKNEQGIRQWINPERSMALSLNFFGVVPDIPSMTDIDVLRAFYRTQLLQSGGGLIQVDLITIQGFKAIKTVFKFEQQEHGVTYLVSLTIPFSHCSYVVKIQASEVEVTGIREAVILNRFLKESTITADATGTYKGWAADPYDPSWEEGFLMNKGEEVQYDKEFPKHPLSQARNTILLIESQMQFQPDLQKLKGFKQ